MSDSVEVIDIMPREEPEFSMAASNEEVISPFNPYGINRNRIANRNEDIADLAVRQYEEIVKETKWIGFLVAKEFHGIRHTGKVVSYDHDNRLYKITYENAYSENVKLDELIQNLASPTVVGEYLERTAAEKKKRAETRGKASTSQKKRAVNKSTTTGTSGQTSGGPTPRPDKYVPLAIRETKKDAFYWY